MNTAEPVFAALDWQDAVASNVHLVMKFRQPTKKLKLLIAHGYTMA